MKLRCPSLMWSHHRLYISLAFSRGQLAEHLLNWATECWSHYNGFFDVVLDVQDCHEISTCCSFRRNQVIETLEKKIGVLNWNGDHNKQF